MAPQSGLLNILRSCFEHGIEARKWGKRGSGSPVFRFCRLVREGIPSSIFELYFRRKSVCSNITLAFLWEEALFFQFLVCGIDRLTQRFISPSTAASKDREDDSRLFQPNHRLRRPRPSLPEASEDSSTVVHARPRHTRRRQSLPLLLRTEESSIIVTVALDVLGSTEDLVGTIFNRRKQQ